MTPAFSVNCSLSVKHIDGGTGKLTFCSNIEKALLLNVASLSASLSAIRALVPTWVKKPFARHKDYCCLRFCV